MEQFLDVAQVVRKIMDMGFTFHQALKLYTFVESKSFAHLEYIELFGKIFDFSADTWTDTTEAYAAYENYAKQHQMDIMSVHAFGRALGGLAQKRKSNNHRYYKLDIKN